MPLTSHTNNDFSRGRGGRRHRRIPSLTRSFSDTDAMGSTFASETFVSFSSSMASRQSGLYQSDGSINGITYQGDSSTASQQKDDLHAWVACIVAFLDTGLLFGLLNIYSLFLVQFQEDMGATLAHAATLGSLSLGLIMLFGPLSSYLAMRFGNRMMMMLGSLLCSASVYGSSHVKTFNPLFATFAVPYALGTALVNVPAYVVPVEYFKKYRAITTGIVASGSSMGMLLLAPAIQLVLEKYGWRTAFRGLSATFFVLIFINGLVRPNAKPAPKVEGLEDQPTSTLCEDLKLWNNRVFVLWVSVNAIVYFGYNIPLVFLASYAVFVGSTPKSASYILMTMGGATTVSRLATGGLMTCDLLSRLHVKQIIYVLIGTTHLLLAHVKTVEGLYVFAVIRGLLDGVHIVMLPNLTASIVGAKRAILGWGHLAGAISITYTVGPLAAGIVFVRPPDGAVMGTTGSYVGPFIMSGLPLIAAGLMLFLLPWAQESYKNKQLQRLSSVVTTAPLLTSMFQLDDVGSIQDFIQHHAHVIEKTEQLAKPLASPSATESRESCKANPVLKSVRVVSTPRSVSDTYMTKKQMAPYMRKSFSDTYLTVTKGRANRVSL